LHCSAECEQVLAQCCVQTEAHLAVTGDAVGKEMKARKADCEERTRACDTCLSSARSALKRSSAISSVISGIRPR